MEKIKQQNKLIAIYGRVSTSNQENEGTIETQLSAVNDHAEKNGYVIVQKYIDEGWSGDNIVRPALDQLRMDAKKKNWEAVLIYDPDRLARRAAWQEVVTEELHELGIDVLYVTVPQAKTDEDKIMSKMRGVFSEYERMKIKERFRLGKVRKAREGHIIATEAPYGYTFITRTAERQGYYEINEKESLVVQSIFSWVGNDGLTLRSVVRKLQELGIAPRKSKRGVWSTSTLSNLLRNKTYIGEAHYGASYAVVPENPLKDEKYKKIKKTSRKSKPESEWIKMASPKIIEEDLFIKVQERLKSNFQASMRNTKNEYLLSHRIWCPCGSRRAGEGPQHGKHLYYRCTSRVKSFPIPSSCEEKGLNARIVDTVVWQRMVELMSSPELMLKEAERWTKSKNKTTTDFSVINIEETKKEISKLKEQEDRFAKAYGAGLITLDKLGEYTESLKEKIALLDTQITKALDDRSKRNEAPLPEISDVKQFSEATSHVLTKLKFEEKQIVVRNTITKIVGTRSELSIYGFIPVTSNINVFSLHRNCWSS
jgi:site-specific DNA recombinase